MRLLVLAMACGLSACAQIDAPQGPVAPLSAEATAKVAFDVTEFVGQQIRPKDGPIAVSQPPGDTMLWPSLTGDLRTAGYTVTDAPARHRLRYAISTLSDGPFLHVTLDSVSIALLYRQDAAGNLAPAGPPTVTLIDEAE
jgi:hypothetical protein